MSLKKTPSLIFKLISVGKYNSKISPVEFVTFQGSVQVCFFVYNRERQQIVGSPAKHCELHKLYNT